MSIAPESNSLVKTIMYQLDTATSRIAVSQLISELQLAVERLSFSGLAKRSDQNTDGFIAQVDLLFEGDLSEYMMDFIHWLCQKNILGVLHDRTGQLFLNHCIKTYKDIKEVRFITPILLDSSAQIDVINRLRRIYPFPSRIICEVSPSLKAGFIINDGSKTVDRSLRNCMAKTIRPAISDRVNIKRIVHG